MCLHAASLYVCACVVVGVYAWIEFIQVHLNKLECCGKVHLFQ